MLKMLIVLGGKDVPAEKISDALWEDAEGDNAHVAFTTTLKRLRHLIGLDDALQLHNGCLSLNPRYCWVDVWAFEYLVNKGKVFSAENINNISASLIEKAVKIYSNGFNLKLDEHPLEVLFYERLRNKFISCVIKLGSYWEQCGKFTKAIEHYKKGIEVEGLSEELYQKLMICLYRHGQSAEALCQYNRMATVFSKILGIEPSAETKNLYKSFTPINTSKLRFKKY
jgi:DNA-binding SARP family transcriptional activator